jgi:predicted porin
VANYSVVGNTYNWGGNSVRQSSMFGYRTPNMGGFTVEMGYVMKADNVIAGVESSKWDVAATYASGPLVASLSANKVAGAKTSAALGGRYKIGQQFAVATSYSHAANGQNIRNGFSLGGQGTFDLFIVTLDLTRDTKNEWGAKKYTNSLLEGRYALSKRTFIYAAYLNLDSTHNYGLGVRHNF